MSAAVAALGLNIPRATAAKEKMSLATG